ncbi:hypothetical protein GMA7_86 [Gordonia phage GMA7]|uniref:Uncharacterized protein n=1 Tax=Gordonia phage GMA7 TaxID=1647286 RepID=A0A0K0N6Z7_9CAUD|nr:hypothetical protein AU104_gp032 [Gordonia phage GMA7]AKJ72523.1 hypothetical protein GMA7_86 [Gordonia phage GMA7]
MSVTLEKDVPLCNNDFTVRYGYVPDMGIEGVTWFPGKCAHCGAPDRIVFQVTND